MQCPWKMVVVPKMDDELHRRHLNTGHPNTNEGLGGLNDSWKTSFIVSPLLGF